MRQKIEAINATDENGNPAGGSVMGTGINIVWQDGPLGRGEERKEPNGAFVEGVIEAALQRIEYYQASRFACADNEAAAGHLQAALECLDERTKDREERQIEGTHSP